MHTLAKPAGLPAPMALTAATAPAAGTLACTASGITRYQVPGPAACNHRGVWSTARDTGKIGHLGRYGNGDR